MLEPKLVAICDGELSWHCATDDASKSINQSIAERDAFALTISPQQHSAWNCPGQTLAHATAHPCPKLTDPTVTGSRGVMTEVSRPFPLIPILCFARDVSSSFTAQTLSLAKMASIMTARQALRLSSRARLFSTTAARPAGEVKRLGVVGAGQMVSTGNNKIGHANC